jgi:mRNA interferase MazF
MRERGLSGETVLVDFPFTDGGGSELRPALVLLDTGDADFVAARVTSRGPIDEYDVQLHDWRSAGLLRPSIARPHKLVTMSKRLIAHRIGMVSRFDWCRVRESTQQLWVMNWL